MKTSLSMLSGLGVDGVAVYEEDFENDFLTTTRAFYRAESQVCHLWVCLTCCDVNIPGPCSLAGSLLLSMPARLDPAVAAAWKGCFFSRVLRADRP